MSMPHAHTPTAAPASPTGRRRITERMLTARAARPAEWEPATRGQVIGALKRAAPALGIPNRAVGLIDLLVGCTAAADWQPGARPIAWPSNATIADALDLGRTQVKTVIRVALDHGLIEMDDSPNGQRFGRREGKNGPIIEAYGFDLTPLLARRAEFEAIAAAHQERRREGGRLRRRITADRNRVLVLADAAIARGLTGADWSELAAKARRLHGLRGDGYDPAHLGPVAAELAALHDRVRALLEVVEVVEIDPMGPENRPHITSTTHLKSGTDTAAAGPDRPLAQGGGGSRGRADPRATARQEQAGAANGASALRGFIMSPELLLQIAPAFRDWLTTSQPKWGDLAEAADYVRTELGVSLHAWGQACVVLGRVEAITVLGVISARHAAGEVRSPGGLLRRMVELHQTGELWLDKTLFGLKDRLSRSDRRH